MLLNPPNLPARLTHCSSHARKEGTESFLVTTIHLLSPLCSSPGSFLTKHQAPVVPPSWGQLGCWAENRSCLNTALPSCFLNAVWASQQGPGQGLEGARRESLEHGTGQPSPTPFASRPWQGLFLAGDSGEETQQAWEVEGGLGRVSNEEDTPGGGEPEGSRLDKIPTVKWPGSLREPWRSLKHWISSEVEGEQSQDPSAMVCCT